MSKVYATLTGCIGMAAVGSMINLAYGYGGLGFSLLGLIALLYVAFTKGDDPARLGALAFFTFCQGLGIGPLIAMAGAINPSIVVTAFLATTVIFAAFSIAAMVATRRSYLYLGGILSSVMMIMMVMSLLSLFGLRNDFTTNLQLGMGLLVFMGYVIFDTQLMIEKADAGMKDSITDALQLFIDFIAIFVRILIILSKMSEKKEKK